MKRRIHRAAEPIQFSTANGLAQAEEVLPAFVRELGQEIEPFILEPTSDVVSVGVRCVRYGFSIVRPAGGS
eukprot:7876061-Alexandrium_andersonii.AAC.1